MSGHSKWATTKHRKGAQDAKRSALFSKLSRNITVAARLGGDPLPENNASLAAAVAKAKAQSMPKDKIKSAIDKAFGSGADAAVYENIVYEGYGPAGVAVYVDCLTDNRNRTAADVRSAFSHAGGNLGTSGSVAFQFERKGQIVVAKEILDENAKKETMIANGAAGDEDEFMMAIAEAGGEDYEDAGEGVDRLDRRQRCHGCLQGSRGAGHSGQGLRDHHGPDHADRGFRCRCQEGPAPHRPS